MTKRRHSADSISGRFTGNVDAEQRVEIDASASLVGNVTSPRLSIADGAYFKGAVDMEGSRAVTPVVQEEGPEPSA